MGNRVLFLTDLHIPYVDERALDLALNYAAKHTFDTLVVSELPDFYSISHWSRDPKRIHLLGEELEQCTEVIKILENLFKDRRKVYLTGNHDDRLQRYIWKNAPALADLPALESSSVLLGLTGWECYDNKERLMEGKKPFSIGHLTFLHGHEIRMGWGAVNVAKILYERSGVNIIAGHFHRCQEWIVRTITGDHEGSWLVGCLCDLNPEYMPHNNWVSGWADINIDSDGDFEVRNRKVIRGKVL